MARSSVDETIEPLDSMDTGRIRESTALNKNSLLPCEHRDLTSGSLIGILEEVSGEGIYTSGSMGQTGKSLAELSINRPGEEYSYQNVLQIRQNKTVSAIGSDVKEAHSEGFDPELCGNVMGNAENGVNFSQKVAKADMHGSRSLTEDAGVHDDEYRGVRTQSMAKPTESDTRELPLLLEKEDKKGPLSSQHMPKSDRFIPESSLCTSGENDWKHDLLKPEVSVHGSDTAIAGEQNDQLCKSSCEDYQRRAIVEEEIIRTENFCPKTTTRNIDESFQDEDSNFYQGKQGPYFYYDSPLLEETGIWIPVSIPPMSESEHQEWSRGFCSNGGNLPEGNAGWGHCLREEKELTMWDVVVEMLLAARGKVNALASGEIPDISWISGNLVEQAWKEMAQTLSESSLNNVQEILGTAPPKWLPDSTASACMLCSVKFHPIMCTRHHCRFCGGVYCGDCTRGRSLLPEKFRTPDPQRVCDVCCVRLESVQPYLMDQVSRAAQMPTHDLTDLSTLRSWVNFPWGQSMEYEIYKATNTIHSYSKVGFLKPEKKIPEAILRHAKGLAIVTVVKVGVMVTYNIGTGLVIARREDGSWSPPSAISTFGVGWGAQAGGELTDFIIVLRTEDAVRTFSSVNHLSVGAGLSAAVGIVGRTVEAGLRAGGSGYAACYTYSCSKGAFIGCSLEGSIVTTRARENSRFYGSQSVTASDILLGSLPRPPAASILYRALADLHENL